MSLCDICAWRFDSNSNETIESVLHQAYIKTSSPNASDASSAHRDQTGVNICRACTGLLSTHYVTKIASNIITELHEYELPKKERLIYRNKIHVPVSVDLVRHEITARHVGLESGKMVLTVRHILNRALHILFNSTHNMPNFVEAQGDASLHRIHFEFEMILASSSESEDLRAVLPSNIVPIRSRKRRKFQHPSLAAQSNDTGRFLVVPKHDAKRVFGAISAWCKSATTTSCGSKIDGEVCDDADTGVFAAHGSSLNSSTERRDGPFPSSYVPLLPLPVKDQKESVVPPSPSIKVTRATVFLRGKYVKNQRGLSQSPWFVDNMRIGSSSVQEMVCENIKEAFRAREYKFHSAGREDMDVRMLGKGRPCVIELIDTKSNPLFVPLRRSCSSTSNSNDSSNNLNNGSVGSISSSNTDLINTGNSGESSDKILEELALNVGVKHDGAVELYGLRLAGPDCMADMLAGAEHKKKTYSCLIRLSRPYNQEDFSKLNAVSDLEILQKTPIRVLHRRTQMTRKKIVHWMRCEKLGRMTNTFENCFILRMSTSAGAYVKEIVHGDRGRTIPNVGSILSYNEHTVADILQLDVEEILVDDTTC